ncbi:MAG: hypothetical protein ACLSHM_05835 [Vescimonas sp.]
MAEGQLTSRAVLDVLGLAGSVQTQQMMRCILDRRTPDALLLLDQLYRSGKDVSALLGELSDLAREMTILKAAPEGRRPALRAVRYQDPDGPLRKRLHAAAAVPDGDAARDPCRPAGQLPASDGRGAVPAAAV